MIYRRPLIAADGTTYYADGSYRVRWALPMSRPPIHNALITVHNGLLREIRGGSKISVREIDLGDIALLPALVNAHTHLEFSLLEKPLGFPGNSFPAWIRSVLEFKKNGTRDRETISRAVREGLEQSQKFGVSLLGEIATQPWMNSTRLPDFPKLLVFSEMLGHAPERIASTIHSAETLAAELSAARSHGFGLSPHAPYSTSLEILAYASRESRKHGTNVAMHLAESREEIELIETGRGPFRDLLNDIGVSTKEHFPASNGILTYLKILSRCAKGLVIHGNYLGPTEIDFLRTHPNLTVVYCPRTHAYFQHERHPIETLIRKGIPVVLGTDSCASSPNLDLWADAQETLSSHPAISPESVVSMVTNQAAIALGCPGQGTLAVGGPADCLAFSINPAEDDHVFEAILHQQPLGR